MSDVIQPICRHTKWSVWGAKAACTKKAKAGSVYCGIHDPAAKKARSDKRYEEFKARISVEMEMRKRENEAVAEQARRAACFDELVAALEDALDFIEDQEDVVDGDEGRQQPNHAMTLAQDLRAALANAKGKKE